MLQTHTIDEITGKVTTSGLSEALIQDLRATYPNMHFTYCMDDDIGSAKPFKETPDFNVYLVDGRDHCLALTNDLSTATGIVLAEVIPE